MKQTLIILIVLAVLPLGAKGQERRVTPLHPFVGTLAKVGEMVGTLGRGESFGENVYSIGDCNKDGLNDWIVERNRTDTDLQFQGYYPKELFLYYGSRDGIPSIKDNHRIGPTEIGAYTRYLAHGDWNADGYVDLACRIDLFNDTSFGNTDLLMGRLVILWGNARGEYSIADTTVLSTGAAMEFLLSDGGVWDYNNDGIDDLVIRAGSGVNEHGEIVPVPGLQIFRGRSREEWKSPTTSRRADFLWWNPPPGKPSKRLYDIDCDDLPDLILNDEGNREGSIAVFYGSASGGDPDTTKVETVKYAQLDGHSGYLIDVTNDKVLDFVLLSGGGETQRIKVWPGEPGERLSEIIFHKSGDSLVWREPWASVPTPNALHDGWGDLGYRLYDLGDGNLDGYNDIWGHTSILSADFVVCYSTNLGFDSLIDGIYRADGLHPLSFAALGNIDGSGIPVIAMGYLDFAGNETGILYFKPTTEIPYTGVYRELPHPHDVQRCFSTVSVSEAGTAAEGTSALNLRVIPNSSRGRISVCWRSEGLAEEEARMTVHDLSGRECASFRMPAYDGEAVWDATDAASGLYYITLRIGTLSETAQIIIE